MRALGYKHVSTTMRASNPHPSPGLIAAKPIRASPQGSAANRATWRNLKECAANLGSASPASRVISG